MRFNGKLITALALMLAFAAAVPGAHASRPVDDAFAGRMSLGHIPPPKPVDETELAPRRTNTARQCRRWRSLATQLGETYAGHRLRSTVLERLCNSGEEEATDDVWSWPWADLEKGPTVPPRAHRTFGDWEIRCGHAGNRRRCALLYRAVLSADDQPDIGENEIVVHFVIDMVAGRETVLWRMFVPVSSTARSLGPSGREASVEQQVAARGGVRYRVGGIEMVERFPVCLGKNCVMEAHIQRSGAVINRLWDGREIELQVSVVDSEPFMMTLPAQGFRAAFGELMRLRRDELRSTGRRR